MTVPARTPPWRTLVVSGALALAVLAAGTTGTRSDWAAGTLDGTGSARSGSLAFTHDYQSTSCAQPTGTSAIVTCAGSIVPPTATTAGAGISASDTITNDGTLGSGQVQAEVRAASCGPVELANSAAPSDPLLPRHGVTFHPSGVGGPMDGAGYVTLDGGGPGGYATSVVASSQPGGGLLSLGQTTGVGVWFRAAADVTGPLFSFAASPSNGASSSDRALYLDPAGRLRLVWNLDEDEITSSTSYDDGAWHFAYATFRKTSVLVVGVSIEVTLWVDGVQQASVSTGLLSSLSSYTGYWHLGWAPTSVTDLGTAYVGASLSNLIVNNSGSAPSGATIGKPATQALFISKIGSVTDRWPLDDPGTTTYDLPLPGTLNDPCAKVDVAWSFTNPAATASTTTPLSTFANGSWRTVAAPPAGGSQTSTITTTRGSGWNTDLAGLRLHAPLSYRVQTLPTGTPWSQTFTWPGAEAAFIA